MNAQRTTSGKAPWIVCMFLLLAALGVFGYVLYATSALPGDVNVSSDAFNPDEKEELDSVERANRTLEETLAALKALRDAEPCDIPVSTNGVSLLPAEAPASSPANPANPSGQTPATPAAPEASTAPTAKGIADPGAFTVSNDVIEASTAMVLGDKGAGWSLGSGFFVAPDMLLTNRHVVEAVKGPVLLVNKQLGVARGTVVAMSREEERDYALVRLQGAASPAPLPLCGDIKKTDKVATWGFPGILSQADPKFQSLISGNLSAIPEGIYSEGVVNVIFDTMPPMILHTAVTSQGNSGGPLVNVDGCVAGINTMIQIDDESYRQTSVALSSRDIATFLWQNGITPQYRSEAQVKP